MLSPSHDLMTISSRATGNNSQPKKIITYPPFPSTTISCSRAHVMIRQKGVIGWDRATLMVGLMYWKAHALINLWTNIHECRLAWQTDGHTHIHNALAGMCINVCEPTCRVTVKKTNPTYSIRTLTDNWTSFLSRYFASAELKFKIRTFHNTAGSADTNSFASETQAHVHPTYTHTYLQLWKSPRCNIYGASVAARCSSK